MADITTPESANVNNNLPAGLTPEGAYVKFKYDGEFTALKSATASTETPANGLNWFLPTTSGKRIEIKRHLYESNLVYLRDTPEKPSYENIDKVSAQITEGTVTDAFSSTEKMASSIPLVTVVKCAPNQLIYNFNEPYKLSAHVVPGCLFKTLDNRKTTTSQIIAFEGIDTKYTYIFYGVDFYIDDKPPEAIKDSTGVSVTNSNTVWQPKENLVISKFDTLISSSNKYIKDTTTLKVGTVILKVVKDFFGVVVFTDRFEAIDPLLITSTIGKEIQIQEAGSTNNTGVTAGPTAIGSGTGRCDCAYPPVIRKTMPKLIVNYTKPNARYIPLSNISAIRAALQEVKENPNVIEGIIRKATSIKKEFEKFDLVYNAFCCVGKFSIETNGVTEASSQIDASYKNMEDSSVKYSINFEENDLSVTAGAPSMKKPPYTKEDVNEGDTSMNALVNKFAASIAHKQAEFQNTYGKAGGRNGVIYATIPVMPDYYNGEGQRDPTVVYFWSGGSAAYKTLVQSCFPPGQGSSSSGSSSSF